MLHSKHISDEKSCLIGKCIERDFNLRKKDKKSLLSAFLLKIILEDLCHKKIEIGDKKKKLEKRKPNYYLRFYDFLHSNHYIYIYIGGNWIGDKTQNMCKVKIPIDSSYKLVFWDCTGSCKGGWESRLPPQQQLVWPTILPLLRRKWILGWGANPGNYQSWYALIMFLIRI